MSEETTKHGSEVGGQNEYGHGIASYLSRNPGAGYGVIVAIVFGVLGAYVILPYQYAIANHKKFSFWDPFSLGWFESGDTERSVLPHPRQDHPDPPVGVETPSPPPKISDPLWNDLQTILDKAGSLPSPDSDLAIKGISEQIHAKNLDPTTSEQAQALRQADEAVKRLAASDDRLNVFRAAVTAWHDRAPCSWPENANFSARLDDYDRERISEGEYRQGTGALDEAKTLLGWQTRGFSKLTPVYFFTSSRQYEARTLEDGLNSRLIGRLNIVDWQQAALCIDLRSIQRVDHALENSDQRPSRQLGLNLTLRWLSGREIEAPPVLTPPITQDSSFDTIRSDTADRATTTAENEAVQTILGLTRSASKP